MPRRKSRRAPSVAPLMELAASFWSFNMLIETTGGRNYTAAEYTAWLRETGFRKVRKLRLDAPGADAALLATR